MNEIEKTIVILKPDIPEEEFWEKPKIEREKFKKIFERIIRDKYNVLSRKKWIDKQIAYIHYEEKKEHPLFNDVINYISSEVSEVLLISWENCIKDIRKIALRMREKYIWNNSKLYNMIHASDSKHESDREYDIHFWNQKKQR